VTGPERPVLVTTARKSPRQEQRERERRYLLTMSVRVVLFVAAIILFSVHLHWEAAIAIAGSLILPWIAVVAANAGPKQDLGDPALYQRPPRRELPPGP
jgi:hypothetical protein